MENILDGLEPELLWKHFYEISGIPRASGNEEEVRDYVLHVAGRNGLETRSDRLGNTVVDKPASRGMEERPIVVLQSHMDMVCEKNKDTDHDFSTDPIRWVRKGGWVGAQGTTLGADNGVGVAAALALIETRDIPHGPLELLFTVDEESGLTGAFGLDKEILRGRVLLNLDSEEEGTIYVGCAGGIFTDLVLNLDTEPVPAEHKIARIRMSGLRGGHSGVNIHEGRGNAIKLLTRFLRENADGLSMRISTLEGGNKLNAIPRECDAVVCLPEAKMPAFKELVVDYDGKVRKQLCDTDKGVFLRVDEEGFPTVSHVFRKKDHARLLDLLHALPHGVLAMSRSVPGTVETSTNLAVIETLAGKVTIRTKQRSSLKAGIKDASDRIASEGRKSGAEVHKSGEYPAWTPNPSSPTLQVAGKVYLSLFQKEAEVKAIHAGLECGIIGDKFPGMDMISFGPTIQAPHSPDEQVDIRSVERFWRFLTTLLKSLD